MGEANTPRAEMANATKDVKENMVTSKAKKVWMPSVFCHVYSSYTHTVDPSFSIFTDTSVKTTSTALDDIPNDEADYACGRSIGGIAVDEKNILRFVGIQVTAFE